MNDLNLEGDRVLNLLDGMQVYKTLETGKMYVSAETSNVEKDYRYIIYVPNEYNSNTNVHAFMHGYSDGDGNELAHRDAVGPIVNSINSGSGENSVLIFYDAKRVDYDGNDLNKLLEVSTYEPLEKLGISTNNITFEGFSAGGKAALKLTAAHIQKNPDLPPQVIVTYDATCLNWNKDNPDRYSSWNAELTDKEVQALADNHSTLITFEGIQHPDYEPDNSMAVKNFTRQGIDVVYVKRNSDAGHYMCFKNPVEDGALGFLDCQAFSLRNSDNYTFMRWVPDGSKISGRQADGTWQEYGEWVNLTTLEVATLISKDMLSYVNSRYKNLMNIKLLNMPAVQTGALLDSGVIESDLKFLLSNVNIIKSGISSTNFLGASLDTGFLSRAKMPLEIVNYMHDALEATGLLLSKLNDASDSLVSIGTVFQEIDTDLDNSAMEILDTGGVISDVGNEEDDSTITYDSIKANDNRKVFDLGDKTKVVINNNGKVEGYYKLDYSYGSEKIIEAFEGSSMISDVSNEGDYLKMTFNPGQFDYNKFNNFIDKEIIPIKADYSDLTYFDEYDF